jgi:hypothetical protein
VSDNESRLVLFIIRWTSYQRRLHVGAASLRNLCALALTAYGLAEAFKLAESFGNRLWKDRDKAPFAVLPVTSEYDCFVRHPVSCEKRRIGC